MVSREVLRSFLAARLLEPNPAEIVPLLLRQKSLGHRCHSFERESCHIKCQMRQKVAEEELRRCQIDHIDLLGITTQIRLCILSGGRR